MCPTGRRIGRAIGAAPNGSPGRSSPGRARASRHRRREFPLSGVGAVAHGHGQRADTTAPPALVSGAHHLRRSLPGLSGARGCPLHLAWRRRHAAPAANRLPVRGVCLAPSADERAVSVARPAALALPHCRRHPFPTTRGQAQSPTTLAVNERHTCVICATEKWIPAPQRPPVWCNPRLLRLPARSKWRKQRRTPASPSVSASAA
jgi:hypothetical protein